MPHTDSHFIMVVTENLGKIILALVGVLLIMAKTVSKMAATKEKITLAEAVLTEKPVSHAELLTCQISVTGYFDEKIDGVYNEMKDMRSEILSVIRESR